MFVSVLPLIELGALELFALGKRLCPELLLLPELREEPDPFDLKVLLLLGWLALELREGPDFLLVSVLPLPELGAFELRKDSDLLLISVLLFWGLSLEPPELDR